MQSMRGPQVQIFSLKRLAVSIGRIKFRHTWLYHHAEDAEYQEVHFTCPYALASGGINPPE